MELELQGESVATCATTTMTTAATTNDNNRQHYEDAVDRILTMRKMETSYSFQHYLQQQSQTQQAIPLSDSWRSKVTQWAFNVVDHFGLSREVVAVSMGIFDRYLATRGNSCSGNMVLLTSLTTLHLAIKLHETKRIKSSVLANLSRGQFETAHIEEMELKVLSALSWKLYSPTPLAFLSEFLHFLPAGVTSLERKEVYELSKYMAELAVCESSFVERQNSVIALAAIRNVMESMTFASLSNDGKEDFLYALSEVMGHTFESQSMRETQERLKTMFAKVSAADCFETSFSGAQTQYHKSTQAARIVSPSGSPSGSSRAYDSSMISSGTTGTASSASSSGRNQNQQQETSSKTSRKTNFWYTPSPPHSRLGVASKVAAATARRGYE